MESIRVSQKYGLSPTIPVCFWCGSERNEIALLGKVGDGRKGEDYEAPKYMVLDYEPCDKCRAAMEAGFTIMEATSTPNGATSVEMQKGAYPTGRFAVLTKSAAKRVFGDIAEKNGKVFVDIELFSQLFPSE